jgi:hypothetical protein
MNSSSSSSTTTIEGLPKLPRHPSTLLKLACDDADRVFEDPRYVLAIDSTYYDKLPDDPQDARGDYGSAAVAGKCAVCFAGAVIAGTLACPYGDDEQASLMLGGPDAQALFALDTVRTGDVADYVKALVGRSLTDAELDKLCDAFDGSYTFDVPHVPSFGRSKGKAFRKAMRKIATKLESIGW